VASDIDAAREVVIHGRTGLLFRKGDLHDMADQILLAASDPALRARIAGPAREHVLRRHDTNAIAEEYLAVLREVVAQAFSL
jgi:glycosyltransferase involved in cell wall biosynthesis